MKIATPHRLTLLLVLGLVLVLTGVGCSYDRASKDDTSGVEAAYVRWLEKRISKLPEKEIVFQVVFKRWLTVDELRQLLSHSDSPKPITIFAMLPDFEGGARTILNVPGDLSDASLRRGFDERASVLAFSSNYAAKLRLVIDQGVEIKIKGMRGTGDPDEIRAWWKENAGTIRFIQPVITELDQAQRVFEPEEPYQ